MSSNSGNLEPIPEGDSFEAAKTNIKRKKNFRERRQSFINKFRQQALPGWYLVPSPKVSICCMTFCWLPTLIVGIVVFSVTNQVKEVLFSYMTKFFSR